MHNKPDPNSQLRILIICIALMPFLVSGCQESPNAVLHENIGQSASQQSDAAKVAILGVFHFGGSSGDLASMHMAEPFGKRRQDDMRNLVSQVAAFMPTKILVEYPKTRQKRLDEYYTGYLSGDDTLRVSETYQVGFRLAKDLGHAKLYAIDYNVDLPADGLVEFLQRHDRMAEFEQFIQDIRGYVANENRILDTMSISAYLARTNVDSVDRLTNETYIGHALSWGDSIHEAGARFASTWWERNFVILKNIAETIESNNDRILVIIGSGHRAVLKDLVIDRSDMEYVEIGEYLDGNGI